MIIASIGSYQVDAYCGALNRQYGMKYGVSLNHALLIVTTPDEVSLTWFDPDEVMDDWHQWQQRVAQFWAQQSALAKHPARVIA